MSNPAPTLAAALAAFHRLSRTPDATAPTPPEPTPVRTVRHLTQPEISAAADQYQAGATIRQIAAQYGIHRHTMSNHLKTAGIQPRHQPLPQTRVDRAIELYQAGHSITQVADQLNAHPSTVWLALKHAGTPRRDTHGRKRSAG